jgi:hypothetical protein
MKYSVLYLHRKGSALKLLFGASTFCICLYSNIRFYFKSLYDKTRALKLALFQIYKKVFKISLPTYVNDLYQNVYFYST